MGSISNVYKVLIIFYLTGILGVSMQLHAENRPVVDEVFFAGNTTFGRDTLLTQIELQPSALFQKSRFSYVKLHSDTRRLQSFYRDFGFISPSVETAVDPDTINNRVDIQFTIDEGPRVMTDSVVVTDTGVVSDSIRAVLATKPGQPLIWPQIRADVRLLDDYLSQRGYLTGTVVPTVAIDTAQYQASVVFRINKGPRINAGPIQIKGLSTVAPFVVKRELTFEQGDILTSTKIRDSQLNLYQTRLFNFVTITPHISDSADTPAPEDTVVPIIVSVDQARYFTLQGSVGYSAYEIFRTAFLISYANLFGRGHKILFDIHVNGVDQGLKITYATPWIAILPLQFNGSIFYRRHDNLLVDVPLAYNGSFYGFLLEAGQQIGLHFSYNLRFRFENVIDLSIPQSEELPEDITQNNTRSISATLLYDMRNDPFTPTTGYYDNFFIELAGLGGAETNHFLKIENGIYGYTTINDELFFSSGLTLGWIAPYGKSEFVPAQEQFYAGGSRSVRGYDFDALLTTVEGDPKGGNVKLVLHIIDFRFPLFWWIDGAVFSDAGYLWQDLSSLDLRDIKYTAGPGIRLITPVGMIRFDIGFQLDRLGQKNSWQWYLDIGPPF